MRNGKLGSLVYGGKAFVFAVLACQVLMALAIADEIPTPVKVICENGLNLTLKRFVRAGAPPILLVPGLSCNDRIWDSPVSKNSVGRALYSMGFDVWIGNYRSSGTKGFRSEEIPGPHHWTVENYSSAEMPCWVNKVREQTGQKPWAIGHSLGSWVIEGYLAGVDEERSGKFKPDWGVSQRRQEQIQGVTTLGGVYSMWWPFPVREFDRKPIRTEEDYFKSNYEMELLAGVDPVMSWISHEDVLSTTWLYNLFSPPLSRIPWIGAKLEAVYQGFTRALLTTSLLSGFYYAPNADPEVFRIQGADGFENMAPHLLEQVVNVVRDRKESSYYHLNRDSSVFDYSELRKRIRVPYLFIAGDRDRLTTSEMIRRDGFETYKHPDKEFQVFKNYGHTDLLLGTRAPEEVFGRIAAWIRKHL